MKIAEILEEKSRGKFSLKSEGKRRKNLTGCGDIKVTVIGGIIDCHCGNGKFEKNRKRGVEKNENF